jgi:hypothetical protein
MRTVEEVRRFLGGFGARLVAMRYRHCGLALLDPSFRIVKTDSPGWFLLCMGARKCLAFKQTSKNGFVIAHTDYERTTNNPYGLIDVYRREKYGLHSRIAVDVNRTNCSLGIQTLSVEAHEVRKKFFNGETFEILELLGEDTEALLFDRMADPDERDAWEDIDRLIEGR